ncbi:putative Ig domain-containing protein, partial [Acidobacteriota bacterium]
GIGGMVIIDGSTDRETVNSPIDLSGIPDDIKVDPLNDRVYALVDSTSTLEIIDAATETWRSGLILPVTPGALQVDPLNNKGYVTLPDNDEIAVVDGASETIETLLTDINPLAGEFMAVNTNSPLRGYLLDNKHGSIAVVEDAVATDDMQIDDVVLPAGAVGVAFNEQLTVTGGTAPYTWSVVSGALPAWLSFDGATAVLSGTPDEAGTWTFMVRCEDTGGYPDVDEVTVSVLDLVIITTALPDGGVGVPYSAQLKAVGGVPPYSWSIANGMLPSQLNLDPGTGLIDGTPDTEETQVFDVEVTDSAAVPQTRRRTLSITIWGPPTLTTIDPAQASVGQDLTVTLDGQNFRPGAVASFSADITVNFTTFISSSQVTADIGIDPLAPLGFRDVTVTNPDSQSSTLLAGFEIQDAIPPVDVGNTLWIVKGATADDLHLEWALNTVDPDWAGSNVNGATDPTLIMRGLDAATLEPHRLGTGNPPDVVQPDVFFDYTTTEPEFYLTVRYIDQSGNISNN